MANKELTIWQQFKRLRWINYPVLLITLIGVLLLRDEENSNLITLFMSTILLLMFFVQNKLKVQCPQCRTDLSFHFMREKHLNFCHHCGLQLKESADRYSESKPAKKSKVFGFVRKWNSKYDS